ncbi:MAG: peptidoglycan-associated lipoprotein Pal [Thermodesulfobacteriota bacterium]|nr:peptidoglycan-associated lipoprotein Pal [Thermodesulfobacteriota bacterium]
MKTFKLLALLALTITLTTGCAKPFADTDDEDVCATVDISAEEGAVPSFDDEAVTETEGGAGAGSPAISSFVPATAPVLQNVYFDFDQHTLTEQARAILEENAHYLQINANANIVIAGHCDERGSDEYNLALGERRAIASGNYLAAMGISPQRIGVISYGEEKPVDSASNEAAWAANRRAEFTPGF